MALFSHAFLAKLLIFSAIVWGCGSVLLFALVPLGTLAIQLHLSNSATVAWDTALSVLFFVQHSGMVRRSFRERLSAYTPRQWQAAIYATASGVALSLVVFLWQTSQTPLLILKGPWRLACWLVAAFAFGGFVYGFRALKVFDLLGLEPIRAELKGRRSRAPVFVVAGPYRWVRHPLYSCVLLLFWANPDVTLDRLLFSALWTLWIIVGTWLEERDLAHEFGDAYREYQRNVPMLLPWRILSSRR